MKKIITFIICLMIFSYIYAEDDFILIPKVNRVLGNNQFSYIEKEFTGVDGEIGSGKRVFLCKEHEVNLDEYEIKKYLITNEEFNLFRKETNYKSEYEKNLRGKNNPVLNNSIKRDFPVRRICFIDAVAYAQWFSEKDQNYEYRLPTNAEWENAAIDLNKNLYPWGQEDLILESTMTDSIVNRYDFSVDAIVEDCSYLGMHNIMGGDEYTLDRDDSNFYSNSPSENPLCFEGLNFMARGIEYYNQMYEEQLGLFGFSSGGFVSYSSSISFRLVKDKSTVFNKGTETECVYYLNRATCKDEGLAIYQLPGKDDKKIVNPIKDLYIIFKTTDSKYYRAFYCTKDFFLDSYMDLWHYGWVKVEDVKLNNKKWYER